MDWESRRMLYVFLLNSMSPPPPPLLLANIPICASHWQDEVFGSAYAAAVYLSSVLKFPTDKRVYVIGMSGLEDELRSEGISFIGGTVSVTLFVRHISNTRIICRHRRILQITHSLCPEKYHRILRLPPCLSVSIRPLTTRSCRARSVTCIPTLNAHSSPPTRILRTYRTRACYPAPAPSSHPFSPPWDPIGQSPRSVNRVA